MYVFTNIKKKLSNKAISAHICKVFNKEQPNHAVQLTPLARPLGWARFTRQSATACW